MTVEIFKNFVSRKYAEELVVGADVFLKKPEGREGFFEDMVPRTAISKQNYKKAQKDHRILNKKNQITDMLIHDSLYKIKSQLESFYGIPLNKYEGGLVKLVTGAKNGLHSDMYMLDGSSWNDGSGREDELEYSALLYLSDYDIDFTGGKITFPKQNLTIYPEKGMLVFFRGDLDHPHEVEEIVGGNRYAIVTFFGK
jgi:hypothetical protein